MAVVDADTGKVIATPEIGAIRDLSRYVDNLMQVEFTTEKMHVVINRFSSRYAVNVEQIEIVDLGNFGHARSQRQIVRRIVEERVTRDFDFVVMDVRFGATQANRLRVGNEMDFVTALGQFKAEFSGDDAAAAIRRIAGNPDF